MNENDTKIIFVTQLINKLIELLEGLQMKNKTNNNNVYPNLSILSKWYSITALATPVAILMSAFIWILFIYLYLKDKEHHFIAM